MAPEIKMTIEEAKRTVGLKDNAFKDYLASRVLFNEELLMQACFFACTSLEKEIKAYMEVMGKKISIKHDLKKLFSLLKIEKPDVGSRLNGEFFEVLNKIYKARYTESLPANYNFTIVRNKFLSELDYSYSVLNPLFKFRLSSIKEYGKTKYENASEKKDPRLLNNNYLLSGISKEDFFKNPDIVLEYRIASNHEIFEVLYRVPGILNDNKFMFEGCKQLSSNSFRLSHKTEELGYH
jgi:HEPN domain-containing protein